MDVWDGLVGCAVIIGGGVPRELTSKYIVLFQQADGVLLAVGGGEGE